MPGLMAVIGGNAIHIDPSEAEADQREKYPLLLHPDERVEMAFQVKGFGRDKSFLTTHRILIKDGKGVGNKRRSYLSIPYDSIQAFAIETAGTFLDDDTELKVYTSGQAKAKVEFSKKEVDLWAIQQFMNAKMDWSDELLTSDKAANTASSASTNQPLHLGEIPNATTTATTGSVKSSKTKISLFDWMGGNAHTMDPKQAEDQLKTTTPVLMQNETVHLAFRERRDCTFFTSHRLLIVDVRGMTGQKIEFRSVPWRAIRAFSLQTAGAYFDVDSELKLHTNIRHAATIYQDFRQCKVDLMAIKRYLSDRILGVDDAPIQKGVDRKEGHVDPKGNWWFRDNQRPLDAVEIDRYYHETVPILQSGERVEYAFKGRRDVTLFTTKRFIDIDPKGLKGVKIEYTSVPWTSILAFGAKTQGKYLDSDSEVLLWTDMMYHPGSSEDDPPRPAMSYLEIDFNPKLVDVVKLKFYLAKRFLEAEARVPLDPNTFALAPTNDGNENMIDWIGDNQRAIDPKGVEDKLREGDNVLLLEDERVIMAFKAGRDMVIFTNLRVMDYDVRGMSGKKIKYTSIPYKSIRAFKAESAGAWDRDAELDLYTRNTWDLGKVQMDFRKGKADILAIQKFLAAIVLGTAEEATRYLAKAGPVKDKANPVDISHFMSWITDNSKEIEAQAVDQQFHDDPPILLSTEKVNRAFRQGRDLYIHTTHRVLVVDVQGLRGKRVEYGSYPLNWCKTFEIETAGHWDRDAEVYVHVDVSRGKTVKQSILVKMHDIYTMHQYLTEQLIFSDHVPPVEEEPEFVLT